ncbi:2-C-methyl-D-erythritol 4-phosphate cytidylyltransferase [Arcanobacterium ihumii]|uniref:2-C-methyl-D-erythritol 4-phosphate cytidylyltransferase n=1 Tax=Arcanobacterium ihumii TaxID=2138162 RepID=UPI000F53875A|nr:2-C-methyl-D-erythritol 4-phosphate cytidylyltransferase [Arcanobacterium ihumii]
MKVAAVIAGAGSGSRLGAQIPKALVLLAGEPLIVHAVRGMNEAGISDVVVTVPSGYEGDFARALGDASLGARLVVGGSTRQQSVMRGLDAIDADFVLVHDAARALTPAVMIRRVVAALENGNLAVIPALAVTDTIKRVDAGTTVGAGASAENVQETLDRSMLRAVQTPQGFDVELLMRAHKAGEAMSESELSAAPDDAALVELLGEPVVAVPGDPEAMKITTPFDLAVADLLFAQRIQSQADDQHNRGTASVGVTQ